MSKSYDAIIIGAGIMGCCTAFELAKKGLKVVVLDKTRIGEGPTGESSAIIRQHYSNELTARMAQYSLKVFQEFEEQIGEGCGFNATGFVVLVPASDRAGLEAIIAVQRGIGINTRMISVDDLRELMPFLDTADMVAAAYEPDSGYVDPYLTVNAYARAARRLGTDVFQNTAVSSILFDAGKVTGVRTVDAVFYAPVVVNCTGAWGAQVAAMVGVTLPIDACRVQVSLLRRPPGHEAPHPVVVDFVHASYFRSDAGGVTVAGLIDPAEAKNIVDPDNYRKQTDLEFVSDLGERLTKRYPALEHSEILEGFASLYAVTPDWHPIMDEIPPASGFFQCSGFSGHGFKLAPAVGVMSVDMITGTPDSGLDYRAFRLSRFEEGKAIHGSYEFSILG